MIPKLWPIDSERLRKEEDSSMGSMDHSGKGRCNRFCKCFGNEWEMGWMKRVHGEMAGIGDICG